MEVRHTHSVGPCLGALPFGCTVEYGTCTACVQLTGELDLLSAPVLQRHLREALAHATLVVLDLRRLSFIDAAGLHVICDASEDADAEDRRLTLLRGPAQVDRLFTLTGLSEKLAMFDVAAHEGNLAPTQAQLSARDIVPGIGTETPGPGALASKLRTMDALNGSVLNGHGPDNNERSGVP